MPSRPGTSVVRASSPAINWSTTTLVWPLVVRAYVTGEMSSNAGGLIRWPVFAMVPIGFALLLMQGASELIKRIAFLKGLIDDPTKKKADMTAEEELAEFVRAKAGGAAQ